MGGKFHGQLSSGQSSCLVLQMSVSDCALLCHTSSVYAQRGVSLAAWCALLGWQAGRAQRLGACLERVIRSVACYHNCFEDLECCDHDRSYRRCLRICPYVLVSCYHLCQG